MSTELLEQLTLIVHLLLALAIIGLIMLQQGKGADMGASFGAGASQTLLGSGGSGNVLTRATAWLVALFFVTSFGLAIIATQKTSVQDPLGIPLPAGLESAIQGAALDSAGSAGVDAMPGDLPVVESAEPAMIGGDLPEIEE
jgi:preprotein translocase subunit SecG